MLILFTILIMVGVAWAFLREGVFTAATMFVNVLLAGLLTFNFWEPLADTLAGPSGQSFLKGYEDVLAMVGLFCVFLGGLRTLTNNLAKTKVEFPGGVDQVGAAVFGLLTGYLVSGFLVCALQTLPWGQHFLDFELRASNEPAFRSVMPPDRVWLALMHRAGTHSFGRAELSEQERAETPASTDAADYYRTFDRFGTFESNYYRFRRVPDR